MQSSTSRTTLVSRYATRLRDALRFVRARCTRKQNDEYTRNLAKKTLTSKQCKSIEHIVAFVVDVAQRGTLENACAIGETLVAIARAEHASTHGWRPQLSLDEAKIAEQLAQGELENAEKALDLDPKNVTKMLALLAASAKYDCAQRERDKLVRAQVVAA
jgi:hypothetical protein